MIRFGRAVLPFALALTAYLSITATGSGHPVDPGKSVTSHWTCRASAGYLKPVNGDTGGHVEPLVANGDSSTGADRDACASDSGGFPHVEQPASGSPGKAIIDGASAATKITPDFTYKQTPSADGRVQHVRLEGSPGFVEADVVTAHGEASCKDGAPNVTTSSFVANLNVNGSQVGDKGEPGTFGNGSNIIVKTNYDTVETKDGGRQTIRRALHVRLANSATQYIDFVVGEVRVGYHGTATELCTAPPARCPQGSTYDATRGVCVITVVTQAPCPEGATRDASGACIVVVGPPSTQPGAGGNVVPLGEVKGYRGPCTNKRFGRQVAILGTKRGDRITGSNKSDRIFVFGGNDRVSGGRGNECIEGGAGSDQLDGSNGSDWLLGGPGNDQLAGGQRNDVIYGDAGNDKIIGGTGSDKLYGGAGRNKIDGGKGNDVMVGGSDRDYIIAGNGRDTVRAGKGNDTINAATAGAAAKIDCGAGVDTVRINNNEIRSIRNCERVFVTTRLGRLESYNEAYKKSKKG